MDNLVLTGPQGTALSLGSYLLKDPGPDFGDHDLLQAAYAENPALEGGALAFESVGVRRMVFPLRLASAGVFGGLNTLEAMLRQCARPNAVLDVQPDGVASSEAVRFDVLTGRVEMDYNLDIQKLSRRAVTLKLDVQPLGYWPTMITLASAASVGMPGQLALPGASVIGDAPALMQLLVQATTPTSYGPSWFPDALMWSVAAKPSFHSFWPAASIVDDAGAVPTITGDAFAIGSQTDRLHIPTSGLVPYLSNPGNIYSDWQRLAMVQIATALEPAYRGRYRAFTYARLGPSQLDCMMLSLDTINFQFTPLGARPALASAAPIATLAPAVATGQYRGGNPSPAYTLLDLGEVTLPPAASGLSQPYYLRLWGKHGSPSAPVPTVQLDINGLYLLPFDGPAGIVPRGIAQPSNYVELNSLGNRNPITAKLNLNAAAGYAVLEDRQQAGVDIATVQNPLRDLLAYHRGVFPKVGASTVQLDLNLAARYGGSGATAPVANTAPFYGAVSVRYRPRFAFLRGI